MLVKRILISFLIALLIIACLAWWRSTPYNIAFEASFFRLSSTIKHRIYPCKKHSNYASKVLFINTAHAKQLISAEDGLGTDAITDRVKLDTLLKLLRAMPGNDRHIVVDLLFDKTSPDDSAFAQTIKETNGIYFPSQTANGTANFLQHVISQKTNGAVSYTSTSQWWKLSDVLLKLPLIRGDSIKSLPLVLYEKYTGQTARKKGGLLWFNHHAFFNTIMIDEGIRSFELNNESNPGIVYPLDQVLIALSYNNQEAIKTFAGKPFIVIGDFESDIHKTPFGDVAGPVIIFNTFCSLLEEDNRVSAFWLVCITACFTAFIYFSLYKKPYDWYEEIIEDLDDFAIKHKPAVLLKQTAVFIIIGTLSYFIFGLSIEVFATTLLFVIVFYLIKKLPELFMTLKEFSIQTNRKGLKSYTKQLWHEKKIQRPLRLLFLLILLFVFSLLVNGQPVMVLNVAGGTAKKTDGKLIHKGALINIDEHLFVSSRAVVIPVLVTGKGVWLLRATAATPQKDKHASELGLLVKTALFPMEKTNVLAGRAGAINSLFDLQNYFAQFNHDSTKLAVLDEWTVAINKQIITDPLQQYFFIRYQYLGEPINKRLSCRPDVNDNALIQLVIDTNVLKVDGKTVPQQKVSNWQLFFFDAAAKKADLVSDFHIQLWRHSELKNEICLIKNGMKNGENWQQAANDYLSAFYGFRQDSAITQKIFLLPCQ